MGHWWGTCRTREQAWFFIQGSACPARGCKKGAQGPCTPSSIQTREKKHKSRFGMNQEFRRRASSSLLVQSANLSPGVIHSLGVWGPKKEHFEPQEAAGRAQGFAARISCPDSSLQRCLVALAIPLYHWGECRERRETRHGSKSSALAGPQHPAWVSFHPQPLQGTNLAQK